MTTCDKGPRALRLRRLLGRLDARILEGAAPRPALLCWIHRYLRLRAAYRRELFDHNPYARETQDDG
jgi:hypothetical protein